MSRLYDRITRRKSPPLMSSGGVSAGAGPPRASHWASPARVTSSFFAVASSQ
jgi:hypothetical protein